MTKPEKIVLVVIVVLLLFVLGSCLFLGKYLDSHKEEINAELNKFKAPNVSITIQTQQELQPETKQEVIQPN